MGNCLQRNKLRSQVHQVAEEEDSSTIISKHSCDYLKEEKEEDINVKPAAVNGKKVKIVLSKEELDWLMLELNSGGGGSAKNIGDALSQIQRSRGSPLKPLNVVFDFDDEDEDYEDDDDSSNCWRPSLETISELPEEEEESERS